MLRRRFHHHHHRYRHRVALLSFVMKQINLEHSVPSLSMPRTASSEQSRASGSVYIVAIRCNYATQTRINDNIE